MVWRGLLVVFAWAACACGGSDGQVTPPPAVAPVTGVGEGVRAAPAAPPAVLDPAALPAWTVPDSGRGDAVLVHAVDVSGDELRFLLADPAQPLLARASGRRVTGRLEAADRAAALAALAAFEPTLALPPPPAGRGAGPEIDLSFADVDGRQLLRLLADVSRRSIVVGAEPGRLSVRVKRMPVGAVLAGLVDLLAWKQHAAGSILLVGPADAVPSGALLSAGGPVLDLDVVDMNAAAALALAAAAGARVPQVAACHAGLVVTVRLRAASAGQAAAALVYAAGIAARPVGGVPCHAPDPAAAAAADLGTTRLLGVARTRTGVAAAFRTADGQLLLVREGDTLGGARIKHIGPNHVMLEGGSVQMADPGEPVAAPPARPPSSFECDREVPFAADRSPGLRLAATVIQPGRASALLNHGDRWYRVDATPPDGTCPFEVTPGRARTPAPPAPGREQSGVREWRLQRAGP